MRRRHFLLRVIPRRSQAALVAGVFLLGAAVVSFGWGPPASPSARPAAASPAPPRHPWIALTFDDGPHPVMTERLLRVLQDEHVPGTFFVVGKMAERYPLVVQEMARDGNEIANHTYDHYRLPQLNNAAILNELDETRSVIRKLTGRNTYLFRPPGGEYTRRTLRATSRAGYHMILWSVLTNDVQGATPRMIYRRIMSKVHDGSIILMHSGMPNTVEALPEVIARLRERGYHFVTVSQLIAPRTLPRAPEAGSRIQTVSRPAEKNIRTQ